MIDFTRGLLVVRVISRHGRANPVTGEAIFQATGVSTREIAETVAEAARLGVRVASCSGGYYKPSIEEIREYVSREKSRLASIGRKVAGVKKNADNPLSLFEQDVA